MSWSRIPHASGHDVHDGNPVVLPTTGRLSGETAITDKCQEKHSTQRQVNSDLNSRMGVLPDCVLTRSYTWCETHQRGNSRCRRVAACLERTSVLRDVAEELSHQGARFSAEAVQLAAQEIERLVEADERNLSQRIASMQKRREQAEKEEDTGRAWEILRDAIDLPKDVDPFGSDLAGMVAEHIAQLTVKLRNTERDLARACTERDRHLDTLMRHSIKICRVAS
jgi:hypothetical protein